MERNNTHDFECCAGRHVPSHVRPRAQYNKVGQHLSCEPGASIKKKNRTLISTAVVKIRKVQRECPSTERVIASHKEIFFRWSSEIGGQVKSIRKNWGYQKKARTQCRFNGIHLRADFCCFSSCLFGVFFGQIFQFVKIWVLAICRGTPSAPWLRFIAHR